MRNLIKRINNRKLNEEALIKYGFKKEKDYYSLEKIINDHFKVIVNLSNNLFTSKIIDISTNEEYILADLTNCLGNYQTKIKGSYDELLNDIIKSCTIKDVYKCKNTKKVISYIKDKYNNELEFLWPKFDNYSIVRGENKKWYALFAILNEKSLGLKSDKNTEIIVIRYPKELIPKIIDNKIFFKGYHMNKQHWLTIKLDEDLSNINLYDFIDKSYELSKK